MGGGVSSIERIRSLIALAVDNPDSEESRTAAVKACLEIAKTGLLAPPSKFLPRLDDLDLHDPAAVAEFLRQAHEREKVEAETYGPNVNRVRWPRRVFCHRCKTIVEGGEESMRIWTIGNRLSARFECLRCFEHVAAPAMGGK